jgi:hypothetical protein
MQITVTPQEEVHHHGPINRMMYRGWPWESGKGNPQPTKDKDQKDSPRKRKDTPHPHTISVGGNDRCTPCKAKDCHRDPYRRNQDEVSKIG